MHLTGKIISLFIRIIQNSNLTARLIISQEQSWSSRATVGNSLTILHRYEITLVVAGIILILFSIVLFLFSFKIIFHSSIYLSIYLSVCPLIHSFISIYPSIEHPSLIVHRSILLSINTSIHPPFVHLFICPLIHPSVHLSVHLSSTHSSIYLCIDPSIYLSIYHPSIHLSNDPSICRYCQKFPHDDYTILTPVFRVTKLPKDNATPGVELYSDEEDEEDPKHDYICHVSLPMNCPLKETIEVTNIL